MSDTSWGVYDYPEPSLKWEREHYLDYGEEDDDAFTDEWEDFYEDEYDEESFP